MKVNGHNFATDFVPRTTREYHRLYVYTDPEFIADVAAAKDVIRFGEIQDEPAANSAAEERRNQLMKKYAVSLEELYDYVVRTGLGNYKASSTWRLEPGDSTDEHRMVFNPKTVTIEDFMAAYQDFSTERFNRDYNSITVGPKIEEKKARTNLSSPHNPRLVYCIFMARRAKRTYAEIFKMYESGTLPGYNGAATISDADNLKTFYSRYDPTKSISLS